MDRHQFKALREKIGASQTQLGRVIDKHPQTISKIERGILKPFNLRRKLEDIMWNGQVAYSWLSKLKKALKGGTKPPPAPDDPLDLS